MNAHKKTLSSLLLSALLLVAATPFPGRAEDAKPAAPAVAAPQKETAAAKKETATPKTEAAAKEAKTAPTDPVAKVGAQTITRAELDRAISVLVAQNRVPQATSPEQRKQIETF